MKVTYTKKEPIMPPPKDIHIDLTEREATMLYAILGRIGGSGMARHELVDPLFNRLRDIVGNNLTSGDFLLNVNAMMELNSGFTRWPDKY